MFNNSNVRKHHIVCRRTTNVLKVVGAWLIIVAMIIDAPITLFAQEQQGNVLSETTQEWSNLPDVDYSYQAIVEQEVVGTDSEVEQCFLVVELDRIDSLLSGLRYNYSTYNMQMIGLNNKQNDYLFSS